MTVGQFLVKMATTYLPVEVVESNTFSGELTIHKTDSKTPFLTGLSNHVLDLKMEYFVAYHDRLSIVATEE